MIVLDTHVFLWYILNSPELPDSIKADIQANPSDVLVPSVCFWEAMMLWEKGRIDFGLGAPDALLLKHLELNGFTEVPLTSEIAMLSRILEFGHNDPADRFIAATAHALKARLATSDGNLRKLPWVHLAY